MSPDPVIPRFLGFWELIEPLGSGYSGTLSSVSVDELLLHVISSGTIFRAHNLHTGQVVALKVQAIDHECPTNKYEKAIYPLLQGGKGMPTLWASGGYRHWSYLAIDLLGSSLDRLYKSSGKDTMDLRSVCCIAMQLVGTLLSPS
jgi:casein kinase 1